MPVAGRWYRFAISYALVRKFVWVAASAACGEGSPPAAAMTGGTCERNSDGAKLLPPSAHLVLNFRDAAPPSPRGVLANATPRRFPLRLITRNLSSGI